MFPRFATLVSRMTSIVISMLVGVGQQREVARALDRGRELTLVESLRARDAARDDLARLGDVLLERGQILVVDLLHAFGGETAELATAREGAVSTAASATTTATRATATRFIVFHQAFTPMSSSSPPKESSRRVRGPPSFSSCAAFAIGDASVTASSMLTTRWRRTASEKRNAPVSSASVF